ncbi:MAG: cell division protein FtsZ [Bellilinea sp.]|nr:MAG: cell division protein FtsZ [Bellilinea sp.]
MNMTIHTPTSQSNSPSGLHKPVLKVVGLGGGGSNAINRMIELGISGVEFIAANTDAQALKNSLAPTKIQLGPRLTRGLGAGGDWKIGEAAAEESYKDLNAALAGADMVFLTAGMGGGTGTGAISIAARVARALGAVTVAVVTTPFGFEIGRRQVNAREGLARLRPYTDTLITIPNDRLLKIASRDLTLEMAFRLADDVLRQGIQGISELITEPGLINVDFAHIRNVMQSGGGSLLSIGFGQGERKAQKAIEQALHHPLIDDIHLENVSGIIVNFTAGSDLTFMEVMEALNNLQEKTNNQAEIIPGVITDERMGDRVQVIMILTGIGATPIEVPKMAARPAQSNETVAVTPSPRPLPVMDRAEASPSQEPATIQADLDIPAFLRRRVR